MSKRAVSGFPELLPEDRAFEVWVEDTLRRTFERHGFVGIETRAVEPLSALEAKGETSKEVYLLQRLQAAKAGEALELVDDPLGLHFDLTVPLARYVLQNSNALAFPFKRYQIQKVWRGERPQEGRFREFTQADVDIVGQGSLAIHHEVEAAEVMLDAFAALGVDGVLMEINNRKVLQGICEELGIPDFAAALRALDKLDKIGADGVRRELAAAGVSDDQADGLLAAAEIQVETGDELRAALERAQIAPSKTESLLGEGLFELGYVLDRLHDFAPGKVRAALRIARGLDYYTGTVYETVVRGHEGFGSVCSGGRYDKLVSDGRRAFPGVGLSVGVTRLVALLLAAELLPRGVAAQDRVLVAVNSEETRDSSLEVARRLRSRGVAAEVSPTAQKFGKQIRYADRKGTPYVWFIAEDGSHSVRDIRTGVQIPSDPETWLP